MDGHLVLASITALGLSSSIRGTLPRVSAAAFAPALPLALVVDRVATLPPGIFFLGRGWNLGAVVFAVVLIRLSAHPSQPDAAP